MKLFILELDRIPYSEGLKIQDHLSILRRDNTIEDTLILLEHNPVITFGNSSRDEKVKERMLKVSIEEIRKMGVEVYDADREGYVTYHGPGQIVGYPILKIERESKKSEVKKEIMMKYMEDLKKVIIQTAEQYDVNTERLKIGKYKLGAVGVEIKSANDDSFVTKHGFAFNANVNLDHFDLIEPCGNISYNVTSIEKILGRKVDTFYVRYFIKGGFIRVFGYDSHEYKTLEDLGYTA